MRTEYYGWIAGDILSSVLYRVGWIRCPILPFETILLLWHGKTRNGILHFLQCLFCQSASDEDRGFQFPLPTLSQVRAFIVSAGTWPDDGLESERGPPAFSNFIIPLEGCVLYGSWGYMFRAHSKFEYAPIYNLQCQWCWCCYITSLRLRWNRSAKLGGLNV